MRKFISIGNLLLIVALVGVLSACSKDNQQVSKAQQKSPEKIKVAQFGEFFLYMPLYVAIEKGFLISEGLEAEVISTGGDDKTFAAVINGEVQFGIADPTFVAIAASKGQPGRVVASIVNGVPFWGVTKNKNIPEIREPSQLAGLTVGTFPSPSTAYTLQTDMFKKAGLPPKIRQAGFGAVLTLLDAGQADIALELEPNVSTAVANGARVVYSMADMYGDFAITGVTVSEELVRNRPDLVQKFVNAIERAHQFIHANLDETISFAQKRFPSISPEIVASALRRVVDSNTLPNHATISEAAWKKACQLRIDANELPSLESAASTLDNSFAKKSAESVSLSPVTVK